MSRNPDERDVPALSLKNESARQRWELFHRAIAHAKQSNLESMDEHDLGAGESRHATPLLSIVR